MGLLVVSAILFTSLSMNVNANELENSISNEVVCEEGLLAEYDILEEDDIVLSKGENKVVFFENQLINALPKELSLNELCMLSLERKL